MTDERVQRLVTAAMRRLGDKTHIDLAVRLDVVPRRALDRETRLDKDRDQAKKVDNWIKGENAPRFPDGMRLLSEAGLLQPEAEAAWRGVSLEEAVRAVEEARARATVQETASLADQGRPIRDTRRTGEQRR